MKHFFTSLFFTFFIFTSYSQTQFWSDNFEDVGAPSIGTRTPSVTFYASNERYYNRVTSAQVNTTTVYSGFQGSKFWGGADVDNITGQNTQSPHQNVTWSSINISGRTNISFRGLFAIGNTANFDHFPGSSIIDYMIVEYRIDAGAWTSLVRFLPSIANSGSGALALETTGDSLAAGEGAALSGTFTEFTANIAGTGSLLDLRFKSENNGTSFEEIAADNFRLFSGTGLPIRLVSFSGKSDGKKRLLNWTTANEQNNERFEIERSNDGILFEKIGVAQGSGTSNIQQHYSYTDDISYSANLYYRLKQVDLDGRFEYSNIIVLNNNTQNGISIFPNPVKDKLIIDLGYAVPATADIRLTDIQGRQMPVSFIRNGNLFTCNLAGLPNGAYIIKVISNKSVFTETILKN